MNRILQVDGLPIYIFNLCKEIQRIFIRFLPEPALQRADVECRSCALHALPWAEIRTNAADKPKDNRPLAAKQVKSRVLWRLHSRESDFYGWFIANNAAAH